MRKVLFFNGQSEQLAQLVQESMPEGFELLVYSSRLSLTEKRERVSEAEFLLLYPADVPALLLDAAPHLRHVQLLGDGCERVDLRAARAHRVSVATTAVSAAGGAAHVPEGWQQRVRFCWENLQRVVAGERPQSLVY